MKTPSTNVRLNTRIWTEFRAFCKKQGMTPRTMIELQMRSLMGQADSVFKVLDKIFDIGEAAGKKVLKVNKKELSKITKRKY